MSTEEPPKTKWTAFIVRSGPDDFQLCVETPGGQLAFTGLGRDELKRLDASIVTALRADGAFHVRPTNKV